MAWPVLTQRDHVVRLDFVDQDCGRASTQEWNSLSTRLWQTTGGGRTWNILPIKLQR